MPNTRSWPQVPTLFQPVKCQFHCWICQGTHHLWIYAYPRPFYTWGLGLINPKVPSSKATIRYLSQQSINNINGGISTIQVYWSSTSQLLSRTHHLLIWHSSQNYNNKWNSIHWSIVISTHGNPTHPLQSRGSPMHYVIRIMAVLCITPLESLQRHHQSCSDLTLGGLVSHSYKNLFERTTYRSTWRPLHQLNQGYYSSYGTFCYIESLHVWQHLFYYSSSAISSSNMIIAYDSINAIIIMKPILQVAIQSPCFPKQLFQQGHNLNGNLILSWPSSSNFFKINYCSEISENYSFAMTSKLHSRILQ